MDEISNCMVCVNKCETVLYIDTNVDSVCAHMNIWTCIHAHVCVCTAHTHIYTQYALFYDTPASQIPDTFILLGLG